MVVIQCCCCSCCSYILSPKLLLRAISHSTCHFLCLFACTCVCQQIFYFSQICWRFFFRLRALRRRQLPSAAAVHLGHPTTKACCFFLFLLWQLEEFSENTQLVRCRCCCLKLLHEKYNICCWKIFLYSTFNDFYAVFAAIFTFNRMRRRSFISPLST